jgi:hypothetical protein
VNPHPLKLPIARNDPHFAHTGSIDGVAIGFDVACTIGVEVGPDSDVDVSTDCDTDSVLGTLEISLVIGFDVLDETKHVSHVYTISPSDDVTKLTWSIASLTPFGKHKRPLTSILRLFVDAI